MVKDASVVVILIHYIADPAEVEIYMAPEGPIKEKDCTNITMQCKVEVGNPEELEQVRL